MSYSTVDPFFYHNQIILFLYLNKLYNTINSENVFALLYDQFYTLLIIQITLKVLIMIIFTGMESIF